MIVYHNGHFVDKKAVSISPEDRGFNFADGVYEVIRSYNGAPFRLADHMRRLDRNLQELRLDIGVNDSLESIPAELLRQNDLQKGDATIYLQISRGVAPRSHPFPDTITPTIYAAATPFDPPVEQWRNGIKVICLPDTRWSRCDIKTVALLPNVLANQQALEAGADEALFVRDGAVTEGTLSNFGAVFNDQLWTYPDSNYILPGITRQVTLDLCQNLQIPVRKHPIMADRLHDAAEAMVMGTTKEITPVVQIDQHVIGNGTPGPITIKLQHAFQNLI